MWVSIIGNNFKDLLDTLKSRPSIIGIIALMFLAGFFIDKWVSSKDDCADELKIKDEKLISIKDSMYNYKYKAVHYRELLEINKEKTDSLFKESNKLIKTMLESNKNK